MPRVSREQMERNRESIDKAAAVLIRERGLSLSVADVMAKAGLTTGGFYGHFSSKDALLSQACADAFHEVEDRWRTRAATTASREQASDSIVDGYLSEKNLKRPGDGCPMPSLAGEVAREPEGKPIKHAFVQGLEGLLAVIEEHEPSADPRIRHERSLIRISLMVGAVALARASRGTPIADELIEAASSVLKSH